MVCMLTRSGMVDLLRPTPEQIGIQDIAQGLAYTNRFAGQLGPYSVAQHSVLVAELLSVGHLRLAGLLHDAHEAYVSDIPRPVLDAMGHVSGVAPDVFRFVKMRLQLAIQERFGVKLSSEDEQMVKEADDLALALEISALAPTEWRPYAPKVDELPDYDVEPWSATFARNVFMQKFRELTGDAAA